MNGIDPFLYRSYSDDIRVDSLKNKALKSSKNSAEAAGSEGSFAEALKKYRGMGISSDKFSLVPSQKEIRQQIESDPQKKKLYEAAEQFEAYFIEKMYREMKKNVPKNSLIDGGKTEEIFDEMLLTERVGKMAHRHDFGLAEQIYRQMSQV